MLEGAAQPRPDCARGPRVHIKIAAHVDGQARRGRAARPRSAWPAGLAARFEAGELWWDGPLPTADGTGPAPTTGDRHQARFSFLRFCVIPYFYFPPTAHCTHTAHGPIEDAVSSISYAQPCS